MSDERAFNVLLIEDDPSDTIVFQSLLEDSPETFELAQVARISEAHAYAVAGIELVVTDLSLPDSTGLDTVQQVLALFPNTAVVVMTGHADSGIGVHAVQLGCQDYLVKGSCDAHGLARTLRYAIERKASQVALRESEERFRRLVEMSPDAILLITRAGIDFANPAANHLLAATRPGELAGVEAGFLGDRDPRVGELIDAVLDGRRDGGRLTDTEVPAPHQSGLPAEISAAYIPYHRGRAVQLIIRDISDRRKAEREQRLASALFQTTAEAMMVTDAARRIMAINPAFSAVTGYGPDDVLGHSSDLLASGRHGADFYAAMQAALNRDGHWRGEVWNRRQDGTLYIQRQTISRVDDDQDGGASYVSVFSDITAEKRAEDALIHAANHDALTGLPNRPLLEDRLAQALSQAERNASHLALMFLDLDGFKPVNDTYGHIIGDQLLQSVAGRLLDSVRGSDTVARIGGDEFVVLGLNIQGRQIAADVATKILDSLRAPFLLSNDAVARISASIGIALFPDNGDHASKLLAAADRAMYQAKHRGKGQFAFIDDADSANLAAGRIG